MVFYGDGASSTGSWHEGLSVAAAQRCPMILMVEANQWAFSTPTRRQTRVTSFVEKAPAYGVRGTSVDGNDVVATYHAVSEAAQRARGGEGVQLVELRTYRRLGHAQHDPADYVDSEELAEWVAKDPIDTFRARLIDAGLVAAPELDRRQETVHDEVKEAAEQAVNEPDPVPESAIQSVYTDVPPTRPWTREVERVHALPPRHPEVV